ncbi:unnamed protein product [Caenorhabditis bovis]|uniref:Uncharacterized protein n=1 Tax=Caenorhabditis bovis TaxID=2654633 RepID=A0A8S1EIW0_9PELO|nr:unnamed protein product [Caenorhabditis bovis]
MYNECILILLYSLVKTVINVPELRSWAENRFISCVYCLNYEKPHIILNACSARNPLYCTGNSCFMKIEPIEDIQKPQVFWPGEFENQLKSKRAPRDRSSTPSSLKSLNIETPSSQRNSVTTLSTVEESGETVSNVSEKVPKQRRQEEKIGEHEQDNHSSPENTETSGYYLDEYLDTPILAKAANNGFLLATSSLISPQEPEND